MTALSLQQMSQYEGPEDTEIDEFDASVVVPEPEQPEPEEFTLQLEEVAGKGMDLAFILADDVLSKIAMQCVENYERDCGEREDWNQDWDQIMAMARGEREAKTFPWTNAANVKYPLILTAALQFGARAYPAIVKGQEVVRVRTVGDDPTGEKRARGDRVAHHMNWQLLEDMPEWDGETDKLVHMLPFHGCIFRQVIWDATYSRPSTSLVSARHLVMTQNAKDLETVPLITKEFELFPHEIIERMRDGRYVETELHFDGDHKQAEQDMLECHCRYDLDDDGYEEPYIAIIHRPTQKLLSLKAGFWPQGVIREEPEMSAPVMDPFTGAEVIPAQVIRPGRVIRVMRDVEFIKYDFIPNFEGKFLGIGFGFLLREHNQIINTIINQLLDAATDQNSGGGFIGKGINIKGGRLEWEPGEWKFVNVAGGTLRENLVPRPTSQPSAVLFQLLGLMIDAGKELASIRDALTGEVAANQPATTTMAIIEQGLQVFSSIYKRIYRSLGQELNRVYKLNGAYLPEQGYANVMDSEKAAVRQDYAPGDHDIRPVSDPSKTTSAQRLGKAQFLAGFMGNPLMDQRELLRRQLEAAEIEDQDKLIPEQQPDPMQEKVAMLNLRRLLAEIRKIEASADEGESKAKLNAIKTKAEAMASMLDAATAIVEIEGLNLGAGNGQPQGSGPQAPVIGGPAGGMGGMARPPADAALSGVSQGPGPANVGVVPGAGLPIPGSAGPPGVAPAPDGAAFPVDDLRGAERPFG